MGKIVWTEQAYEDLESIFDYIGHDSISYAKLLVENILTAIRRLEAFPKSGRVVPEYHQPDIRELIVRNYRIIYRTKEDAVELLAIRHSARYFEDGILN
jgi:addiction module RelE/StbE family toxin